MRPLATPPQLSISSALCPCTVFWQLHPFPAAGPKKSVLEPQRDPHPSAARPWTEFEKGCQHCLYGIGSSSTWSSSGVLAMNDLDFCPSDGKWGVGWSIVMLRLQKEREKDGLGHSAGGVSIMGVVALDIVKPCMSEY